MFLKFKTNVHLSPNFHGIKNDDSGGKERCIAIARGSAREIKSTELAAELIRIGAAEETAPIAAAK